MRRAVLPPALQSLSQELRYQALAHLPQTLGCILSVARQEGARVLQEAEGSGQVCSCPQLLEVSG